MNKKRLLKLADYLETVPRQKFSLSHWKHDNDCKTVACACGHACDITSFKSAGLKLEASGIRYNGVFNYQIIFAKGKRYYTSFRAVEEFFGLSRPEAEHLFAGHSYKSVSPTPKGVAKRIRSFVASQAKVLN